MFKKRLLPLYLVVSSLASCSSFYDLVSEEDTFESFSFVDEDHGLEYKSSLETGNEGESADGFVVSFMVEGAMTHVTVPKGEYPVYNEGKDPVKPSTPEYEYKFVGWQPELAPTYAPQLYIAVFEEVKRMYNVTFIIDGKEEVKQFGYKEMPDYGMEPTVAPTTQYEYKFVRWVPELTQVTEDAVYTAEFEKSTRKYNVTFKVDNEEKKEVYEYGQTPSYGKTPTRASTAEYSYSFKYWKSGNNTTYTELPIVTKDVVYTAIFEAKKKIYKITFNVNGTITRKDVEYGQVPTYGGTPTRANDAAGTYAFDGWQKDGTGTVYTSSLPAVTGATTYVAKFSLKTKNKYKIKFKLNGYVVQETEYYYGANPTYNNKVQIRSDNTVIGFQGQTKYKFKGWDPVISSVKKDQTYSAKLEALKPSSVGYCWGLANSSWSKQNVDDSLDKTYGDNRRFYITSLEPGFYQFIYVLNRTGKSGDLNNVPIPYGILQHNSMSVEVNGPNDIMFTNGGMPMQVGTYTYYRYNVLDVYYFPAEEGKEPEFNANGYPPEYEWRYSVAKNKAVVFK